MSQFAIDQNAARARMVDSQIRPNMVSDPRILNAMRSLPRERFLKHVGNDLDASMAYADRPVRIGPTRMLMEPRITARLLQAVQPRSAERVLVLAAGTGYMACLLAMMGLQVVALEQDAELAATGIALCAELAPGVAFVIGPLAAGWQQAAPYHLIIIDGAVRSLPEALAAQLAPSGRLAAVLWPEGRVGSVVLAEASTHGLRARPQFDAAAALIPELAPTARFTF